MGTTPLSDHRPAGSDLSIPRTPLFGREAEVIAVQALLARDDAPLVTLTGPSGVGKTRLALQVAAGLAGHFADGAAFVSLAPVTDAGLVASTIAQALGIRDPGDRQVVDSLKLWLGQRQLLLVLDNFEQILPAAPLVGELLGSFPGLTVLVTSRAALHISGEQEFLVPPLALPEPAQTLTVEMLDAYAATALFVERARAVRRNVRFTDMSAQAVAAICRQLDGLPLAIELAAARINVLSPEAILVRLDHRLALLTDGPRDQPPRLQTLRNAIAWSYDLLAPAEQQIFWELAVFSGGWTLEAAEAVAASPATVLDRLSTLITHSLISRVEQPDGTLRYSMLETIREYAAERLVESDEEDQLRWRHVQYFLKLARSMSIWAGDDLRWPLAPGELEAWLRRLADDHDNLRSALAWALDHEPETALRMTEALGWFWYLNDRSREGRRWLELALAAAEGPPMARMSTLSHLSAIAAYQGAGEEAVRWAEASLAIARDLDLPFAIFWALHALGRATESTGDLERAIELYEENIVFGRQHGMSEAVGTPLGNLGNLLLKRGDIERGEQLYREMLALARATQDDALVVNALIFLADVLIERKQAVEARAVLAEALQINRRFGARIAVAYCLEHLAAVALLERQPERAARLLGFCGTEYQHLELQLLPTDQQRFERVTEDARQWFGKEAFTTAFAAGRELEVEEAIALALAVEPRLLESQDGLTARELEVLRLIAAGKSNREIGELLFISPRTVERHIANIYLKIDVNNRAEATAYALSRRID